MLPVRLPLPAIIDDRIHPLNFALIQLVFTIPAFLYFQRPTVGITSVSYTHLDVYKRQAFLRVRVDGPNMGVQVLPLCLDTSYRTVHLDIVELAVIDQTAKKDVYKRQGVERLFRDTA